MSELTEAAWMPYIAKRMGFEAKLEIYENKPRCVIKTKSRNWRVFNILTNPADCLAAIRWLGDEHGLAIMPLGKGYWGVIIMNYAVSSDAANLHWANTGWTLEQAVFKAAKRMVGDE